MLSCISATSHFSQLVGGCSAVLLIAQSSAMGCRHRQWPGLVSVAGAPLVRAIGATRLSNSHLPDRPILDSASGELRLDAVGKVGAHD